MGMGPERVRVLGGGVLILVLIEGACTQMNRVLRERNPELARELQRTLLDELCATLCPAVEEITGVTVKTGLCDQAIEQDLAFLLVRTGRGPGSSFVAGRQAEAPRASAAVAR